MEFFIALIAWWMLSLFLSALDSDTPSILFWLFLIGAFLYRRHTRAADPQQPSTTHVTDRSLIDLSILRSELAQHLADGTMDHETCETALEEIDALIRSSLTRLHITSNSPRWREGRDAAWLALVRQHPRLAQSPPWQQAEREQQAQLPLPLSLRALDLPSSLSVEEKPFTVETEGPVQIPPTVPVPPVSPDAVTQLSLEPAVPPAVSTPPLPSFPVTDTPSTIPTRTIPVKEEHATTSEWTPAVPSALERTLQTISRWPALLVPFLAQNILWFICGLCFVAGSTSLIASTSGPTNSLAVSLVLLTYSGFLLWGGYRLCRTRPELITSGTVLLALGAFLIPLNIASTVRLVATAQTGGWVALGFGLTAGELVIFYYTTMLVSGVMDRFLQGRHPQLFLALTTLQVMVPVLTWYPSWIVVALTHSVAFGLLAFSTVQFTHEWLHSILGERRKVAYYAVGTLMYTALVSCIHVTWGVPTSFRLPLGYAGPFLMGLCGLLFYVDAQLKRWTNQYAFLSRISFFLYGLSIVALLLSANAFYARILTLCLALGVYGVVVWQYLTFVPLLLFLGCFACLYHSLILQSLASSWYLLASLPALVVLLLATRWLQRLRETPLISTSYQTWLVVTFLLCVWSVGHTQPGLLPFSTILTTIWLILYGLGTAPAVAFPTLSHESTDLRRGPLLYAVMALASLASAYCPQWPFIFGSWSVQTASGLILLSAIWTGAGLHSYFALRKEMAYQSEVLLNSALLNLGFALLLAATLAVPNLTAFRLFPVLLGIIGSVGLWLGLALRIRGLLYGVLLLWGLAGIILKVTYFPGMSSGIIEMVLALSTWTLLWWVEHESTESRRVRQEALAVRSGQFPPLRLLWLFPVACDSLYVSVVRLPLQQTMVLLWGVGIVRLVLAFIAGHIGWGWVFAAFLGTGSAVLGAGYFRAPLLFAVAVWLGLGTWLAFVFHLGFVDTTALACAGVLFSAVVWKLSNSVLHHSRTSQLATFLHCDGDRTTVDTVLHWSTVGSGAWCVMLALSVVGIFTPSTPLFGALLSLIVFLSLAGWHYQQQVHSYLALAVVILTIFLSYSWSVVPLHDTLHSLLRDHRLGLLAATTGLVCWMTAWELGIQHGRLHSAIITRAHQQYHLPLCHVALFIAVFAMNQQLGLAWLDPLRDITILSLVTLVLASVVLFGTGFTPGYLSLQIAALLMIVLAVLWGESLLIHPHLAFTLWPGKTGTADQWLMLSLAATGLALLTYALRQRQERQSYAVSTQWAAAATYFWALLGTLLFCFSNPFRPDLLLSLSVLALIFCLFPLLHPWAEAAILRGVALPLLGYPFLLSILVWTPLGYSVRGTAFLWGFFLWAIANFAVPHWNARRPQWAVASDVWPWFGLFAVALSLTDSLFSLQFAPSIAVQGRLARLHCAGHLTVGAVYCFLMLRNSSWSGFAWVGVFLLTRVGSLLIAAWWAAPPSFISETSVALLPLHPPIGELLWLNLFLLVVPWWNRHGTACATWLGWNTHPLPSPFVLLPAAYFVLRLAQFAFLLENDALDRLFPSDEVQGLYLFTFAIMLTLSFIHLWQWHTQAWVGHALFASLLSSLYLVWLQFVSPIFHVPFFFALWSAALRVVDTRWGNRQQTDASLVSLRHILSQWVEPSLAVAVGSLLVCPVPLYEQLLTLLMLIDTAVVLGWQRQQRWWIYLAAGMGFVFLHDWPLLWIPFSQIPLLLPWYALQLAVVAWVLLWTDHTLHRSNRTTTNDPSLALDDSHAMFRSLLPWAWKITAATAVLEWGLHASLFCSLLAMGHSPRWLSDPGDVCAALIAAALLLGLGIRYVWTTQRAHWVYGITLFLGAVGWYVRLHLVGLAPASAWDTTAILFAAYGTLALYHFSRLTPLLHIVMGLPLLLGVTIPFHLASSHAGTALIATTALYFLTYRENEQGVPLYLAFVTVNLALYLWIPVWAEQYQVAQLYLTPAALSVLLLAHFHRHELPPHVLNGSRLAATATLYVSATADVFFHPGVGLFLVALVLSMGGVLIGIAARIRAFLYTGVVSLVWNIGWQLIMFFPEQRLSQAVILLVLAGMLAGIMIWFNIKREAILQRVRLFRSDLETWG